MGQRGPTPKPTALKMLEGTYRPDRANGSEVFPDLPVDLDAPEYLTDAARTKWNETAPVLARNGLLTECDVDALAVYCQTWVRWLEAEAAIETEGTTSVAKTGYQQVSPWVTIAKQCRSDLLKYGDRLGLNPSARGRIAVQSAEIEGELLA